MIAEALESRLKQWNTVCTLGENQVYREWLEKAYPHWKHTADFSRLQVQMVNAEHTNMLCKDGWDYIAWFSPRGVMNTTPEFASAGLLVIGGSASGNPMVIDTLSDHDWAIGFVSHEALWGDKAPPRVAFRPWKHDLLTFLDRMSEDVNYVP